MVRSEGPFSQPTRSATSNVLGCAGPLITVARVGLGVIVLALGVWVGYDQTTRAEAYQVAIATLSEIVEEGIPTLSADEVTTGYDGRWVHVQGSLVVPPVTDSLTGLAVETWRLVRTVELRQWQENQTQVWTDPESSPTTRYSYEQVWSSDLIDSDDFNNPPFGDDEHLNPGDKPYSDEIFISDDFRLGAWRLPVYTYGWPEREEVPSELLETTSLADGWVVSGGYVYDANDPDVRIRYTYHPLQADTYSVIGVPEDGVLDLSDEFSDLPLAALGSVSAEEMVAAATGTERGVQSVWMIYAWVGLLLLLRPVARRFRIFHGFTEAPFPSRLLRTGGIAAVIVLVLAWLMP